MNREARLRVRAEASKDPRSRSTRAPHGGSNAERFEERRLPRVPLPEHHVHGARLTSRSCSRATQREPVGDGDSPFTREPPPPFRSSGRTSPRAPRPIPSRSGSTDFFALHPHCPSPWLRLTPSYGFAIPRLNPLDGGPGPALEASRTLPGEVITTERPRSV